MGSLMLSQTSLDARTTLPGNSWRMKTRGNGRCKGVNVHSASSGYTFDITKN
ncbi:hypothetical protein L915_02277 [Phytophthora nicotianae]|uniref:Uncharacterized protein n=1 Tax=Phytophthora nicotianae TaxID=4792 RepID=W2HJG1_PHYNI|nr:hypothetical protein L915_02277 [Phytophthora nicotianae]ETL48113.1 hypothetical protein L916_02235 [Phytophthora nicotianae]